MQKKWIHNVLIYCVLIFLALGMSACRQANTAILETTTGHAAATSEQAATTAVATSSAAAETTLREDSFNDGTLPDFWHIVSYVTLADVGSQAIIQDGALSLTVSVTDRAPILVSDPIAVSSGDILTVSRKVRLHYANDYFNGAMRITSLEGGQLNLTPGSDRWDINLGKILANIDYLHYFYLEDKKAATDGFVLYNVVDGGFSASQIASPVFDQWFEEKLVYHAKDGLVKWTFNGQEYSAQGLSLQQPAVSVIMHSYGWYTGHGMDIDQIDIKITRGAEQS